jgi:ribosomal-protein-alanine N-acetyltransferase
MLALVKACFGRDAWSWIDVLQALTAAGTVRLKAEAEGELIGFVIGDRRRGGVGWIASLGVHPAHRRRGLATRLLKACERGLRSERVRLTLRPSNQAALALYRAAGYQQVEVWPRYYRDGEDGLVMEKVMAQGPRTGSGGGRRTQPGRRQGS